MSNLELLSQAQRHLENLSTERLRVANDFLGYLEECESNEATAELLAISGFREALRQGEAEVAEGRLTLIEDLPKQSDV